MTEECKHKETMFQPPIDIPKIMEMTTVLLEKERKIDPFLPEMPKSFLERNITSMLMKILGTDFNGNLSQGELSIEEVASKLLEEVTERLYNLENENDVDFENNHQVLDKENEVEINGTVKEEVTHFKPNNAYQHPEHRFQPPRDIPKVILLTTDLLKEEKQTNPFLPELPKSFFAKYLDTMLKKIDQNLFRNGCPQLRQMKNEEIASKLLDEAIEKLFDIEVDIEKESKDMNKTTVEIKDIVIEEELQCEEKSSKECLVKKKKWNIRRLFRYFIPCINKKED